MGLKLAVGIDIRFFAPDILQGLLIAPARVLGETVGYPNRAAATNAGTTMNQDLSVLGSSGVDPIDPLLEHFWGDGVNGPVSTGKFLIGNIIFRSKR